MKSPRTMLRVIGTMALVLSLHGGVLAAQAFAAQQPAAATGQCNDGSYSTAHTERGACSGHGGVAKWFGTTAGGPVPTTKTKGQGPAADTRTTPGSSADHSLKATGSCKDGTSTTASAKRGACSGHGGVAKWFADEASREAPVETRGTPRSTTPADRPSSTPSAHSQAAPAEAPQNATAQCNDGSYSFAKQHSGACSHHKGVKVWFK